MRVKLTDTAIRSYPPRAKPYSVGDASCPGLRMRVTPAAIKTFAFAYRNKATRKVEWLTIGRYPEGAGGRQRCPQDGRQRRDAVDSEGAAHGVGKKNEDLRRGR